MIRALVIDETVKRKVARVLEYAKQSEHFYDTTADNSQKVVPGDNGNLQAHLDTYRCVFSYTKSDGKLFRHLSISVPGGLYPNVFAGLTIADMFGFIGWDQVSENIPEDWYCRTDPIDRCVVLIQALKDGEQP